MSIPQNFGLNARGRFKAAFTRPANTLWQQMPMMGQYSFILIVFVVGTIFGVTMGALGTLCMALCLQKKDAPTVIEKIVEVNKPKSAASVPQEIYVGLTERSYCYHDKHNPQCKKWVGFTKRGKEIKQFTPCPTCFKAKCL